ncbi:ATP-binding protein [Haloferax sp. ATB1]|uniref:ATP-binding protein n=1 Tax=Haloferax sp. ATB1 TaxID=1508454 RepID=UPI00373FCAB3
MVDGLRGRDCPRRCRRRRVFSPDDTTASPLREFVLECRRTRRGVRDSCRDDWERRNLHRRRRVGIPPAERESVLDAGYSTKAENPGYGLHIVEGIAELHDWNVSITSSTDGGARFELTGVEFVET